jgi:hypothetical protein
MKKLFTLLAFVVTFATFAQAPQGFNYQATVRNSSGQLLLNQIVQVKFKIVQNSSSGTIVYSETQTATTDDLGQINLVVGQGTAPTGTFSSINWGSGSYYLGIELNSGTGYVAMGTSQLMSVPYALYSANSTVSPGNSIGEIRYWNGNAWVPIQSGTNGQVLTLVDNTPKWQTLNSTIPPNNTSYLGYVLAEPLDAVSQNAIGLWTYNAGGNFNGFYNTGIPNTATYANDMAIYAQYPGWFGNSGNFITNVSTLSNSIRQSSGSGVDSNGCLQGQYKLGSVGITATNINPSIQYSYTIWIPLAGVGGIFTNMIIDVGIGGSPCSTNISNGTIPEPGYAAINVTVPSGCAIPAGIYRVLWLPSLYNFPSTTPLQSTIWIKGS